MSLLKHEAVSEARELAEGLRSGEISLKTTDDDARIPKHRGHFIKAARVASLLVDPRYREEVLGDWVLTAIESEQSGVPEWQLWIMLLVEALVAPHYWLRHALGSLLARAYCKISLK
jgi:hypothetical protein